MTTPLTLPKSIHAQLTLDLIRFPTLYGRSYLKALSDILLCNGNGYYWVEGEPRTSHSRGSGDDSTDAPFSWNRALEEGQAWLKGTDSLLAIKDSTIAGALETAHRAIEFTTVDTGSYSLLGHLPDDVTDDWLQVSAQVLLYVLHFRQAPQRVYATEPEGWGETISEQHREDLTDHNHYSALELYHRYQGKFGDRKGWRKGLQCLKQIAPYYADASIWDIRRLRELRQVQLSAKTSREPRPGETSHPLRGLLSLDEYIDYHELDSTGFEAHLDLLCQMHARSIQERTAELHRQLEQKKQRSTALKGLGEGTLEGKVLTIVNPNAELLKLHKQMQHVARRRRLKP
jgi:hypothetical protein